MRELTLERRAVGAMAAPVLPYTAAGPYGKGHADAAVFAAPLATLAQSDTIFLCVDEQGNKSFQNVGSSKGCKRLDVVPVLSVPAARLPAGRSAAPSADERATVSPASFR